MFPLQKEAVSDKVTTFIKIPGEQSEYLYLPGTDRSVWHLFTYLILTVIVDTPSPI